MKKIYLFSFLLLILTGNLLSQSGWFWQNPLPQGNDLYTNEITSDGSIFSGGNSSTIMKSTNNANSWLVVNNLHPYQIWFNRISFIDQNSGWAVGSDWCMYYTTNQGNSWILKYSNNAIILKDIFIKSPDTSWVCGTNTSIVRTTNNWSSSALQSYNPGLGYHLNAITFTEMNVGICVGGSNNMNGAVLYLTSNSGNFWNQISSPVSAGFTSVVSLPGEVILVSSAKGHLLRTTNYGTNWEVNTLQQNTPLNKIAFINSETGWVTGDAGLIFKTTNSGINWSQQVSQTSKNLLSVKFVNANTGYIVGQDGYTLRTFDSGLNWIPTTTYIDNNPNLNIEVIRFLNENTGYIFGWNGLAAKSTNGGINWIFQESNVTGHLMRAHFIDEENIWAAGYNGSITKTTNGGENWSPVSATGTNRITGLYFFDMNTGYVLSQSPERILKTTNSGVNWFSPLLGQRIQTGNNIFFVNQNTGFIVCNAGLVYKTENSGGTWTSYLHSPTRDFKDVYFINSLTGWISGDGGIILKTTNSGLNWSVQSNSGHSLSKIYFTNENYGWAVGYYGFMLLTTNGGANWYSSPSGTSKWLQGVSFINNTTGWVVGSNCILKTTNGGNIVSLQNYSSSIPENYSLLQNYPNPFNPVTKIKFDIPEQSNAKIIIYDLLGRVVSTLVNEQLKPGSYSVDWDGAAFASGVYFYSLVTEGFTETKRMVLVK